MASMEGRAEKYSYGQVVICACCCAGEGTRHGSASVSEGGGSRAFTDCWFTLAALEGDPVEQQRVRKVIRQGGGRIFDAGRTNLVTNLAGAYAVCPLGFPPQLRREAMRHPDFKKGACSTHCSVKAKNSCHALAASTTCPARTSLHALLWAFRAVKLHGLYSTPCVQRCNKRSRTSASSYAAQVCLEEQGI